MPDLGSLSDAKRSLLEGYLRDRVGRPAATIPRRDQEEPVPLSYEQEQIWLHAQMAPDLPLYNEPVTIEHRGLLDIPTLERSFNEILRRHEAWRTSIQTRHERPVQVVHRSLRVSLPLVDLRQISEEQREAEAARIAKEDARKAFDLSKVPLFRATLIQLGDEEHRLYLTLHHIIFDGVAIYRVFLPELATLYREFSAGRQSPLQELPIQYADYACWQRRSIETEKRFRDAGYWRRQLAGDPAPLALPLDRPRKATQTFRGSMYQFVLGEHLTRGLKALSQREGVTLFQSLLTAFAALLHRYSSQGDVSIGSVTGGRNERETQNLLGCFLNTVVLRINLSGNPSFSELLKRVRDVALDALDHDSVPFGQLIKELQIQRDPRHNPLFQAMFIMEPPLPKMDPAWGLTQTDVDTGVTKYDLYFELDDRDDRILARFHYSTDLFDAATIGRMAEHWEKLLEGAVANPDLRVSALPLLTDDELLQLEAWNSTACSYPRSSVHELFEAQVLHSADSVAVTVEDQQITYRELNVRANQLAHYLRKLGVGPDVLVGLYVQRSVEMIVGLLGILKAGGAYIPLDPAYPRERLTLVLSDAKPRVLVTQQQMSEPLSHTAEKVVRLDTDWDAIAQESAENPIEGAGQENLAYVIYTSGSSGTPKGVRIEHHCVVNFLCCMQRELGTSPEDVLLAVTTLSFDIAALEMYLPLISGARLVIACSDVVADGTRLSDLLHQSGATVMQATPATWRLLIEAGWQGSSKLQILCGGEALAPELGRELALRGQSVCNLYGPTETTIWSALHRVTGKEGLGSVPIGRPLANTQIYVLDADLNPVPVGVCGELYIGGHGLAKGYLNRPELTAEKFVANPFSEKPGSRLYKTGDRARFLADGNVEFLGREDNQVKIRGFRIELGEIEATLTQHSALKAAVVSARDDVNGEQQLVAYVISQEGQETTTEELRRHLKVKLPEYMVPARFVFLDSLPLTPNGKVDRRSLPAPDLVHDGADRSFATARDELEVRLTEIWQSVLGVRPIGIRDDFFALGGHSLLAVRLFARIEKSFGNKIPLATLFRAPTIEQLANVLRENRPPNPWISLVPIQPAGSLPPLFCVHGHFGDVLFYRILAQRLGPSQPFVALQARGKTGLPAHHTIEAMASDYLTEVQRFQPKGPYFLAGYCFGARVAFEMAHQLRAQGESVAFLGFFMDYDPKLPFVAGFRHRVLSHFDELQRMGAKAKLASIKTNVVAKVRLLPWRLKYWLSEGSLRPPSASFQNMSAANLRAVKNYVPRVYPGRITVFLGGRVYPGTIADFLKGSVSADFPRNPKTNLYGMDGREVEVLVVPVVPRDCNAMMDDERFVCVLAEQLSIRLSQAASAESSKAAVGQDFNEGHDTEFALDSVSMVPVEVGNLQRTARA